MLRFRDQKDGEAECLSMRYHLRVLTGTATANIDSTIDSTIESNIIDSTIDFNNNFDILDFMNTILNDAPAPTATKHEYVLTLIEQACSGDDTLNHHLDMWSTTNTATATTSVCVNVLCRKYTLMLMTLLYTLSIYTVGLPNIDLRHAQRDASHPDLQHGLLHAVPQQGPVHGLCGRVRICGFVEYQLGEW